MLLDARGIECSTGSACSAGVPQPSHVLLAMGCDEEGARHSLRFSLGRTSTAGRRRRARRGDRPRASSAPGPRATRAPMKVVAAMSGGVDSAVAAARAAEAGHDVTGIHLALSRNPASYRSGARGCCTIEDANDARRAADVIGIPFYVWDLSERFHEDVVEDFMDEYAAGRTPNPCLRCNEKIKFAAVLDRALGARLRRRRHRSLRPAAHRRRRARRAAPGGRPRQGPVLRARRARPRTSCAHSLFPLGDTAEADGARARRRARGLLVADKPDSHDICFVADGDNAGWLREKLGDRAPNHGGAIVDDVAGEELGRHDGTYGFTIGQRTGLRLGMPARRRQAAVRARHRAGLGHGHGRAARGARPSTGSSRDRPRWCGAAPDAARRHRAAARPRRRAPRAWSTVDERRPGRDRAARPGAGHRARARPRWSTTAPASSAPPPSSPPRASACPHDAATGVGSLARRRRRSDYAEAVRVVLGELPDLPHLPELPGRGRHGGDDRPGARRGRRTSAPTCSPPGGGSPTPGHRPPPRPLACSPRTSTRSRSRRRTAPARSRSRSPARGRSPPPSRSRAATRCSPTTARGASSRRRWPRACATHLRRRTPPGRRRDRLVVQVDEPALAAVLAGAVPTASGFGRHRAVAPARGVRGAGVGARRGRRGGAEPWVHSCAAGDAAAACCAAPARAGLSVDLDGAGGRRPRRARRGARGGGDRGARRRTVARPGHRRRPTTHAHRAGAALARHARPRPRRRSASGSCVTPVLRPRRRVARLGPPGPGPLPRGGRQPELTGHWGSQAADRALGGTLRPPTGHLGAPAADGRRAWMRSPTYRSGTGQPKPPLVSRDLGRHSGFPGSAGETRPLADPLTGYGGGT